jgi:MFS family permease
VPALGVRNYRIFFTAQSISLVGTWMQTLGQAWLIVVLTRDPLILGLATAAQGLPILLFTLFAGALADRADKRRLLMTTPLISITVATTMAILCLTGAVQVWHVLVLAFLVGTVQAIEIPCRQSFITEMVGPEHLPSALGLNAASYNSGRLIGPALAGVLIGIMTTVMGGPVEGTGVAFLVNAATYLVVIVGFLLMRPDELLRPARPPAPRGLGALVGEIGEGLSTIRHERPLLATFVVPGLIGMLAMNFNVLIPLIALEYRLDSSELGLLMAANGVGAFLAAVRIGMGGRANTASLIRGAVLLGFCLLLTGLLAGLRGPVPLVAALLLGAGLGGTSMRVATNTSIQLATPPHMRGRAMSLFALVFEGSSPLGGLVTGITASILGGPAALAGAGVAAFGLIVGGKAILLQIRLDGGRSIEVGPPTVTTPAQNRAAASAPGPAPSGEASIRLAEGLELGRSARDSSAGQG